MWNSVFSDEKREQFPIRQVFQAISRTNLDLWIASVAFVISLTKISNCRMNGKQRRGTQMWEWKAFVKIHSDEYKIHVRIVCLAFASLFFNFFLCKMQKWVLKNASAKWVNKKKSRRDASSANMDARMKWKRFQTAHWQRFWNSVNSVKWIQNAHK